jgi:hypothetical protein
MTCAQLGAVWLSVGGSRRHEVEAEAVAYKESTGRWWALNAQDSVGEDRGLWQINSYYFPKLSTFSIRGNARAARIISNDGRNWQPWVSFQNGREIGFCGYRLGEAC